MTLSLDTLKAELRKLTDPTDLDFVGFSADPDKSVRRADAAAKWATAFDNYGQSVENVNEDTTLVAPNKLGFETALTFDTVSAVQIATEFGAAWTAYWTGVTFNAGTPDEINTPPLGCPNVGGNSIFGIIATSVVTAAVAAALILTLTAFFTDNTSTDPGARADELATILHNASTTAVVVLTSGSDTGGPVPITNTCELF